MRTGIAPLILSLKALIKKLLTMRTDHRSVGWVPCGVEPAYLGSNPRLGTGARIFLDLFQDLTTLCFQW
jgi:hypothetical protein